MEWRVEGSEKHPTMGSNWRRRAPPVASGAVFRGFEVTGEILGLGFSRCHAKSGVQGFGIRVAGV